MTTPALTISADLAATLTAQIPPRLIKKLDADPELAARWTWSTEPPQVTTDKGEVITLSVTGGVVTAVACSCLLAPRCLHVAAVVARLPPAEDAPPPASADGAAPHVATAPSVTGAAVVEVAARVFRVAADVLAGGADSTGAFAQAELLRAIHACRAEGVHRLAAALTRVLRSVRELRGDRPEFDLEVLTADLREALAVSHTLAAGASTPALIGAARRDYEEVGSLRLRGVCSEAVVARSGYAGVITYLVDDRGQLYTRADVAPGDAGRAAGAYDAPANLGDAVLPHRELCRAGLFVAGATASADGRLGAGQRVSAVRAAEPSRWDHEVLAARWRVPFLEQLAAVARHDAGDASERPAGWDLVFVDGVLLGGSSAGVGLAIRGARSSAEGGAEVSAEGGAELIEERVVMLSTPHDQRVLVARDNLAVLARSAGLRIRAIGRVRIGAPGRLELLALGASPELAADEPRLTLAEAWHGRANVDYDRLSIPKLADAPTPGVPFAEPPEDLLAAMRRRIERVVLGGLGTLPIHALGELEREARSLAEVALHGGAEVLRELAAITHDAARAMAGTRRAIDHASFAVAWLRAALYEDAARRALSVASW